MKPSNHEEFDCRLPSRPSPSVTSQEAGEGEAEGFELAEEDLVEAAETGVTWVEPVRAAFPVESEDGPGSTYGEADHELSSELPDDDR